MESTITHNLKPEDLEPRRSKGPRKESTFCPNFYTYILENDPTTYHEAMQSPDAAFWREALISEINSILANHTWELGYLPQGTKPLGYTWILKREKFKIDPKF